MSRHSQDREDLLRDAKALVPRAMMRMMIADKTCNVFAGFRGDALSLYFDGDPVYHFNSRSELRRAFADNQIIKADRGELFVWNPDRQPGEVSMISRRMSAEERQNFSENLLRRIEALRIAIQEKAFGLAGQYPTDDDVTNQLKSWLEESGEFKVAHVASIR